MEKYSKFRDRGSGVAPFLPLNTPSSAPVALLHVILFALRLPFFLAYASLYFVVLHPLLRASTAVLPRILPVVARKLLLWLLMAIPGIWWMDLQLDGVKRGHLAEQPAHRFPGRRTVIAATFTSPIDAIYLAAIFDPVFTISYPNTRLVRRVGLLGVIKAALGPVRFGPRRPSTRLTDLQTLLDENPERVVAVFPECGTTNGKAILPFSPSLLACSATVPIYPVTIRYSPPDVTTPIPGRWMRFLWHLLSRPTTCIRVRIAEPTTNSPTGAGAEYAASASFGRSTSLSSANNHYSHQSNYSKPTDAGGGSSAVRELTYGPNGVEMLPTEQRVLDRISETLARLGMSKRVALTLKDKAAFVEAWNRRAKRA